MMIVICKKAKAKWNNNDDVGRSFETFNQLLERFPRDQLSHSFFTILDLSL